MKFNVFRIWTLVFGNIEKNHELPKSNYQIHINKQQFKLIKLCKKGVIIMKFVKGMIIGTMVAAGVAMMYNDGMMNKKRMMKRGKQLAKKMGAF